MQCRRFVLLVASFTLFAAACSGDDGGGSVDPTTPAAEVDYQIFSADEGAGCGVFVSVPENAVDGATDVRAMLWAGVVSSDFTTCGFSDVVEAGLLTVNGLDEYNQPDWSNVVEHGIYSVTGWDELLADCYDVAISSDCAAALGASLRE